MTRVELQEKLMDLPIDDRLHLAQALWASAMPETYVEPDLSAEFKADLEQRRAAYLENPAASSSWEDVKARILQKL